MIASSEPTPLKQSYKVIFLFGTRPEAIKMSPLIIKAKADGAFTPIVCVTAQHREMLDQVLDVFGIRPDYDLDTMKRGQTLFHVTSRGLRAVEKVLREVSPDMAIVQGDTSSTFLGSLAAFYLGIPVGHVEGGLRTGDKRNPFPEEINRRLVGQIADLHFAPTPIARENLLLEGIPDKSIYVTGNTAIDALLRVKDQIESGGGAGDAFPFLQDGRPMILVTAHRRESFGAPLRDICEAVKEIAEGAPGTEIVYPVHPNPVVKRTAEKILRGLPNVHLIRPPDYRQFISLMMRSRLILTDSGGIQEEAPSLGKPVLVMREVTERIEAVELGIAKVVGTRRKSIVSGARSLLMDERAYKGMVARRNPYGDGKAAARIVAAIKKFL